MLDFYNQGSRLARKKIKQAYFKVFGAVFLSGALILGVIFLGIPALIKISAFLNNFRPSYEPITTIDTTPPFPPRLEPLSEATNSAKVLVKGFSEPGSIVEIFLNGENYKKIVASNEGTFETEVNLYEGENRILAQAQDEAKNTSQPSETLFITYEKEGPKLEVSEPKDKAEFTGERLIYIQGFTNPDNTLIINGRYVIISPDGSFSYPYSLSDGENEILIQAFDSAGNKKEITRKVKFSP